MTSSITSLEDEEEESSFSSSAIEHQQYVQLNISGEVMFHRGSKSMGGGGSGDSGSSSEYGCSSNYCDEVDCNTSRKTTLVLLPLSSMYDLNVDENVPKQRHQDTEEIMQHYSNAVKFANASLWNSAYEEITLALACCCRPGTSSQSNGGHSPLYYRLLAFQADILIQMQDKMAALCIYQHILSCSQSDSIMPMASTANLSFICAKLSAHLGEYQNAYDYYQLELKYTTCIMGKGVVQQSYSQPCAAALARIHHSMAEVCKKGLGDLERALIHYKEALAMEQAVKDSLQKNVNMLAGSSCCDWVQQRHQEQQLQEIAKQIQSTKQCIGRIYYEQGYLDKAVQATFA